MADILKRAKRNFFATKHRSGEGENIMKKVQEKTYGIHLTSGEAHEIFSLLQSILRDNTPDGDDLDGEELITNCLLHNDPETFRERNKAFSDAVEQFGQIQGIHVEPEQETFQEAEEEYTYLALIANIYFKLFKAGKAA